jgi:hypothetical protein
MASGWDISRNAIPPQLRALAVQPRQAIQSEALGAEMRLASPPRRASLRVFRGVGGDVLATRVLLKEVAGRVKHHGPALVSDANSIEATSSQGLSMAVCWDPPLLWVSSRRLTSDVRPT